MNTLGAFLALEGMPSLLRSTPAVHADAVSPSADTERLITEHLKGIWRYLRMLKTLMQRVRQQLRECVERRQR